MPSICVALIFSVSLLVSQSLLALSRGIPCTSEYANAQTVVEIGYQQVPVIGAPVEATSPTIISAFFVRAGVLLTASHIGLIGADPGQKIRFSVPGQPAREFATKEIIDQIYMTRGGGARAEGRAGRHLFTTGDDIAAMVLDRDLRSQMGLSGRTPVVRGAAARVKVGDELRVVGWGRNSPLDGASRRCGKVKVAEVHDEYFSVVDAGYGNFISGDSGGPVTNAAGQLVALVSAVGPAGTGYANRVDSKEASSLLEAIFEDDAVAPDADKPIRVPESDAAERTAPSPFTRVPETDEGDEVAPAPERKAEPKPKQAVHRRQIRKFAVTNFEHDLDFSDTLEASQQRVVGDAPFVMLLSENLQSDFEQEILQKMVQMDAQQIAATLVFDLGNGLSRRNASFFQRYNLHGASVVIFSGGRVSPYSDRQSALAAVEAVLGGGVPRREAAPSLPPPQAAAPRQKREQPRQPAVTPQEPQRRAPEVQSVVHVYIATNCPACSSWKTAVTRTPNYNPAAFEGRTHSLLGSNGVRYEVHWELDFNNSVHRGYFPSVQLPPGVTFR